MYILHTDIGHSVHAIVQDNQSLLTASATSGQLKRNEEIPDTYSTIPGIRVLPFWLNDFISLRFLKVIAKDRTAVAITSLVEAAHGMETKQNVGYLIYVCNNS